MTLTVKDSEQNDFSLDWLVSHIRWGWLLLAAIYIATEGLFNTAASSNSLILLLIIGVGFVLNGIYVGLLWAKFFPEWLAIITTIVDIALAIGLAILLSKHGQLLLPLMLFPVLTAGLRWNTEAGLIAALPIVISYALPLARILSGGDLNRQRIIDTSLDIVTAAVVLFVAAILSGLYLQKRIELTEAANKDELERLRLDNERGKLITEMALTMSSTMNYRKVLRSMIDLAFSALVEANIEDETTIGMVLLFEENENGDGNRLTVASGRNIARTDERRKVTADTGILGRTVNTAEVTITHNVQRDKSLSSFAATQHCRSAICAPLRAGFHTYGVVLFCTTEPNFYNEDHKKLLTTFCSQAIIALQNAQLFEDLRYEQQKILEKDAEARRKLARDLHDGPTQSIAAIAMRLNFIKMVIQNKDLRKAYDEIVKVEEIAQKTTQEIRTMLFAMRPVILETQGLEAALEQYAERLRASGTFDVIINNRGYNGQLSQEAEGVVFAIIEEAIGNARKHSQATEIRINMVARSNNLYVEVIDNGVGFDVEATKSTYDQRTSLGLINMDERAREVGGHSTLSSEVGRGTTVTVQVPFERAEVI